MASAPLAELFSHLRSAIREEISPNFNAKAPPKLQHCSHSFISRSSTPSTGARNVRGCCFTPSSRSPEQAS
jgi:hypothetical protein